MRLLLMADLHLGSRHAENGGWTAGKETHHDRAWAEAVELALDPERRIDAVLSAGDLFDHPTPPADLVARVAEGAEALLAGGIGVVLLPGAYDGLTQPNGVYSTQAFPAGTLVIDWSEPRRAELPLGSNLLHLYTAAARPGRNGIDAAQFARQEIDGCHVGLLHGVVGACRPEDPPCLWGRRILSEDFFAGCDLDVFVLGGGHDYAALRHGRTLVVQPGAPFAHGPDGPARPGFLVADLDDRGARVAREGSPPAGIETPSHPHRPPSVGPDDEPYPDEAVLAALRAENSMLGHFVRRMEARCAAATGSEREATARALGLGVAAWQRAEAAHVD